MMRIDINPETETLLSPAEMAKIEARPSYHLGRHDAALASARAAVALARPMADDSPDEHLPLLVSALRALSVYAAKVGYKEESEAAARDAEERQ